MIRGQSQHCPQRSHCLSCQSFLHVTGANCVSPICIEQIQELRETEGVAGVHIMAIEWEAAVVPIVEGAGLLSFS
jgi:hypothetical protein